ncbi:unnamed protein product [Polarella glacialis]|uniref:Uncharacterized protein n=1 Tax=Polarella glacialis TaxID=89957 RepID=A0A813EGB0_POLGL|nr:unnamed protein product [Polarella glacialis]
MRVSQIARSRIISPEISLSLVIFPGVIFLSSYVFLYHGCLLPWFAMELQDLRIITRCFVAVAVCQEFAVSTLANH